MADIDLGAAYLIAFDVTDADGALAHANTATLTVTLPDGTTVTPGITDAVTGQYRLTYLPAMAGRYQWAAVTTVPNTSWGDTFNVRAYASLLSLAEAKAHLNITGTSSDDELRNFLSAATELIESKVGPCVPRTFTERVSQGACQLALSHYPVTSVTSVTSVWPGGPSWTAEELFTDTDAGIVAQVTLWPFWWGPWDVAYVSGRQVIPERFLHACKELVRHLWETQRGSSAPSVLQGEEMFTTAAGFAFTFPRRVLEAIEADMTPAL
jgi:Phage gp6-like head-tail connector protein